MPPGNEKGAPAGSAPLSNNTASIDQTQSSCKKQFPDWPAEIAAPKLLRGDRKADGQPVAPVGYAWEDDSLVPVASEPSAISPRDVTMLHVITQAVDFCDGSRVRWAAFRLVIGQDSRSAFEIAEHLGVSKRIVEMRISEARKWLLELRAELESEGA